MKKNILSFLFTVALSACFANGAYAKGRSVAAIQGINYTFNRAVDSKGRPSAAYMPATDKNGKTTLQVKYGTYEFKFPWADIEKAMINMDYNKVAHKGGYEVTVTIECSNPKATTINGKRVPSSMVITKDSPAYIV